MRLLITGAGGFIGSRLTQAALARPELTVRTLARRDWSGAPLVLATERFFGELPFDVPEAALEQVDAVVHCAASTDTSDRRAWAVNVLGTLRLAQAARAAGVGAFVFLSSQSARAEAPAAYGRTKHAAEQALRSVEGLRVTIIRPGLVCGRGGLFGRMVRLAERLPVIPLVGAEAPVQPLYVGDLVEAILRIVVAPDTYDGSVIQLGTPESVPLGDLVALIAHASRPGRRKRLAPVPTAPLIAAVSAVERRGLSLPVTSSNLAGMRTVRTMQTMPDMQRLGVPARPASEIVRLALSDRPPAADRGAPAPGARAADTLLIGAGRIGLVHALTLSRLPGACLAGVADRAAAARRLLRSTGVRAPSYASLEQALAARAFDAAVIATPPASHLTLARQCVEQGLNVLIEKPACVRADQIAEFETLQTHTARTLLVGYLMPGMPHLATWIARLQRGELGAVTGFDGFSLVSLLQGSGRQRWETRREVSGGGVLANASGHVLSLIRAALGAPCQIAGETRRIVSSEVEDTATVRLGYAGFDGCHYSSWCIEGFPRQENRLIVRTQRGVLLLTINMGIFVADDGAVEITHQLDYDLGFNLAPDYAGGGIARELNDLAGTAPTNRIGPSMSLERALEVERLLFNVYAATAAPTSGDQGFTATRPVELPSSWSAATPEGPTQYRRVLDLRDLEVSALHLGEIARGEVQELAVYADALPHLGHSWDLTRTRLTLPNLLHQTRLINDGRHLQLLKDFGPAGVLGAARAGAGAAARRRDAGFWVAVSGLLTGELATVPRQYAGTILLHPYVVDLALTVDELASLESLVRMIRRARPRARVGLHSNLSRQVANAVSLLSEPIDALSVLASPNAAVCREIRGWLRELPDGNRTELTAEVGPAPRVVHQLANRSPARWATGADGLLVSGLVDRHVFERTAAVMRDRWAGSFGAAPLPAGVW